jgi:hypothetical protein
MPIDPEVKKELDLLLAKGVITSEEYKQRLTLLTRTASIDEISPTQHRERNRSYPCNPDGSIRPGGFLLFLLVTGCILSVLSIVFDLGEAFGKDRIVKDVRLNAFLFFGGSITWFLGTMKFFGKEPLKDHLGFFTEISPRSVLIVSEIIDIMATIVFAMNNSDPELVEGYGYMIIFNILVGGMIAAYLFISKRVNDTLKSLGY